MKLHLPNSAFIGNIDPFLKNIDFSNTDKLIITANHKWIAIHPVVLSMIAALGLPLKPKNIFCEALTAKSAHYLQRMGLFDFLGIESGLKAKKHEPAGRFIPLTNIKSSEELSEFIQDIIPLLHLQPFQVDPIRYIVSELVRNVIEHSQSETGAIVSAQYYKNSNRIAIGIVDTGVGIKKTINQSHVTSSHLEAIRLALIPGITGTTNKEGGTEYNAGAGLFFIKSIAKVNRNFFMIYSGNALYKLLKTGSNKLRIDPFDDNHSKTEDLPHWNGTAVGVDISLDETKEFSDLLDLIRNIYSKAVKERRKAKYRKPKLYMKIIKLNKKTGSFAENKDIARELRLNEIIPALEKNESVVIDFKNIDATTQSFIHALISDLIRKYGNEILDKLSFKSCNDKVKKIIIIVTEYMQESE